MLQAEEPETRRVPAETLRRLRAHGEPSAVPHPAPPTRGLPLQARGPPLQRRDRASRSRDRPLALLDPHPAPGTAQPRPPPPRPRYVTAPDTL